MSRPSKKNLSSPDVPVRAERSLLELPLFMVDREARFELRVIEQEKQTSEGPLTSRIEIGFNQFGTLIPRDRLVYLALTAIWQEQGKPVNFVVSLRRIAKLLNMGWGKKQILALKESLHRLKGVNLIFINSLFDASKDKTVEKETSFTFLDKLEIFSISENGKTNKADCVVAFNHVIDSNLRLGHVRPVMLPTLTNLRSDLAQSLYLLLDAQTCNPNKKYSISSKKLLAELGLTSSRYSFLSRRKEILEKAIHELDGIAVLGGTLKVSLEPTRDGTDLKLTAERIVVTSPDSEMEMAAVLIEPPSPRLKDLMDPTVFIGLIFDRFGIKRKPKVKELEFARNVVSQYGIDLDVARHIVEFAFRDASRTKFLLRDARGLIQYIEPALESYEEFADSQGNDLEEASFAETYHQITEFEETELFEKAGEKVLSSMDAKYVNGLIDQEVMKLLNSDKKHVYTRWERSMLRAHARRTIARQIGQMGQKPGKTL